ncbi:MAG: 1-acyl-sn-glycerol-3-phosphate acyltransferase [Bryobacterales bacterium]|nr:1-acyl-sn-glycerol-3-phosphate acyltransferase [Bryobacterales bacterium]
MSTLRYLFAVLVRAPLVILFTAVMGTISLFAAPFDPDGRKQLAIARVWARMLLRAAGARVKVVGLEKLDPHASYVVCPTHISYMDTPVLLTHVPVNFRFLAKKELFAIPLLGGHLGRAGNISVPLEDPRAALKVLSAAGKAMQEKGLSMLVFPEGGRSEDGQLQPFKDGAAYLAIKGGVPLVPIAINGIGDVLPIHGHQLKPGPVTLRIGDPIPTAGLAPSARTDLTRQLYDSIVALQRQGL